MSKKPGQKAKIIKLMQFFEQETDENCPATMQQITEMLDCERKSIYSDINELSAENVLEIEKLKKDRTTYYYHKDKLFEPSELKLLIDAVLSSKMITEEKSIEIINKLKGLTGPSNRKRLNRQLYATKNKTDVTKNIMSTIDVIQEAISLGYCIKFRYYKWTVKKELVEKHSGKVYTVSPATLAWADENYYLVGYDEDDKKMKHFRVDKIKYIRMDNELKSSSHFSTKDDIPLYLGKFFSMFGSDSDEQITLLCKKGFMENVIIDRFGKKVTMMDTDDEHFTTFIRVYPSKSFLSWLISFGDDVKIIDPPNLKEQMKELSEKIYQLYQK
ncbi:MAG: WYL domain-containing protein [Clostridia bacterium]|nr:WYL domain-containing protein [Clostridia bacterium]